MLDLADPNWNLEPEPDPSELEALGELPGPPGTPGEAGVLMVESGGGFPWLMLLGVGAAMAVAWKVRS